MSASLPATMGGPGDRASHGFKASSPSMCPGTLSRVEQPKEARIKEDEKVWVSQLDSWGQNKVNKTAFNYTAALAPSVSPAGFLEDHHFSRRLTYNVMGFKCLVLQM